MDSDRPFFLSRQGENDMTNRNLSSVVLLLVLALVTGCGGDDKAAGPATGLSNPTDQADTMRLVWKGAGPDGEAFDASASPVTEEMVRQKLESIDWARADAKPSLAIVKGPGQSLKIALSQASADGSTPMVALWKGTETEGPLEVAVTRQSAPLTDTAAALSLLLSYLESRDDWADAAQWTIVTRGSSPPQAD